MQAETAVFSILALAGLVSAAASVTRRDPLSSSLWLLGFMASVAALTAFLGTPLVASAALLISGGLVMTMTIFAVMLMDPERISRPRAIKFGKALGAIAAGYLAIVMIIAVAAPPFVRAPATGAYFSSAETVGMMIFSRYAPAFALAGAMFLTAVVSCVLVGMRRGGR